MRARAAAIVCIAVATLFACFAAVKAMPREGSSTVAAIATGSKISEPEIVGEGVISTDEDEFGGGVTPDGKTLIFCRSAAPHYLYVMGESHLVDGKWSNPEMLPFSGQYRDTDPVIAPDGKSILFASDRPVDGKDPHRWSIWRAARLSETKWGEPELVSGAVNSEGSQVFASIASNGNMYFATSRKTGNYDVFRSKRVDGKYLEAEDLGQNINGPNVNTFEALIAPDESYLLLGSFGRTGGLGSSDLWVSFPERGAWGEPINLGPKINGKARDYSPRVSADGQWLYFTSEKGFLDNQGEQPFSFDEFSKNLASVTNGLGNLYRVPLQPVLEAARKSRH
ncbi:MAG: PD40 domain-containing protein [Acidobacteria bacterium]|nr:PD40 domain-containing protein [Acidobacteriota bacterium]